MFLVPCISAQTKIDPNQIGPGTLSSNIAHTGNNTHSGIETFTNKITAGNSNSILYVDGTQYANIAACVAALPTNGGECWTPPGYTETITAPILLGNANTGNAKCVTLRTGRGTILTFSGNGFAGTWAIGIPNCSSILADGQIGANGSNLGGTVLQVASSFSGASIIANTDSSGAQEYFNVTGIFINDNSSATVTSAVIDLQAIFVPSYLRDVIVVGGGHKMLRIRNAAAGAGFGPLTCDNCWFNGNAVAGSTPVSIESVAGGGTMAGFNFISGAIEHAGTGLNEFQADGTNQVIQGINFFGTYFEHSFNAGGNGISLKDCINWSIVNSSIGGTTATDALSLQQSGSGRMGNGLVLGLQANGWTHAINDVTRTTTIAGGVVPFYSYINPGNPFLTTSPSQFSGTLNIYTPVSTGTAAALTGTGACATITTQHGGAWAGDAKCTGTTGASTLTITPGITAPTGWSCNVQDMTTRANLFQQTSNSPTTCVLTVTSVTQNDVFAFTAVAY